ncbi:MULTISPECIES: 3-hydroxyacyl-CoA dehydrogenase NAD-binding domain-containing protein [Rhodococcus]|uniref:3-hydroxyacyl-CoA dehydrogenase NAD-binding domain-containing protein n=1 Tax=Rhodococcus TaxID=1827 RepID=UPI0016397D05|nr:MULTISPECIES: 3-hydroxyacyl-CoA dehydrogenase NAD-binding domain-containing protein [Rhodococcus]MBC2589695.1 enoyl-CoA hydratase/isomerase family protein [Rhodococcus aetherivorans]QRI77327.1 enoyl-CoA hydratase/isomerase family protein [Rhodococcus aetherivorans]QSE60747.1 enoyl-CoA hydratase/isomerase family protein [Rhodococcus sp. PSBB066]QSE67945.1 enoyl-CoA hydratase/isomerase family protein [Rhodococcus sp. PSBB049]
MTQIAEPTSTERIGTILWEQGDDGIVVLTFDDPNQSVNTMNAAWSDSLNRVLDRLAENKDGVTGVVVTSAKKTFFAGGDLNDIYAATPEQAGELAAFADGAKAMLRRIETAGVPVVAAIAGAALGGGLEIALACHHRIAVRAKSVRVGLPEVTLGLLPGGGGIVRTVRLLGLGPALDKVLLTGASFTADKALEIGLIDEVVDSADDLVPAARAWIAANPDATQPWDRKAPIPGGTAYSPSVEALVPARVAAVRAAAKGAPNPAREAILATAVESTQVGFDVASAIETRYFVGLATGQISKNIIQGTFFDRQAIASGASRPEGYPTHKATYAAVLGAGLMGAGIALSCALVGIKVGLKDVDLAAAEKGKDYARRFLAKQVKSGRRTQESADEILALITPVADAADLVGADLVVEAVFEDPALKKTVFGEVLGVVAPDAVLGSNTSTLPITDLAAGVDRPEDFIGLHFFSPVERMDLLEIIVGEKTSDATLAKAFDIARQLGKTPIVVGDGRGFYTSRVILQRLTEAAAMVGEGIDPQSIEQASVQAGYRLGTLALLDEVTSALPLKIRSQFREVAEAAGTPLPEHPGDAVLTAMVEELGRPSRVAGAGFYEYKDGKRGALWSGLAERFPVNGERADLDELKDRLLFAEVLETVRCHDDGVLRSTADANVGSLLGIGFPTWTGGTSQFIAGYPGGTAAFVRRAQELADKYGPRFTPPASLTEG